MLSERKKKILTAVVDRYIECAEPISSKEIGENYLKDCSTATIRNELSALESMGFLVQPHISAGRVPSEKAFRLYVDELMSDDPLTQAEIDLIEKYFTKRITDIEEVVAGVAQVISDITNYTSVVVKEDLSDRITSIKLVNLSNNKVLVVIVTDARLLKDAIVELPENFSPSMLANAENWLNKIFIGKHISEFLNFEYPLALVNDEFREFNSLFKKIIDVLRQVSLSNGMDVITSGGNKIFEHSEYSNIGNAKSFLSTLDHKDRLAEIFTEGSHTDEVTIKIGKEDSIPDGCSVVSAKINLSQNQSGNIGVIGPVRMNYKKVKSVLDKISEILSDVINGL